MRRLSVLMAVCFVDMLGLMLVASASQAPRSHI